MQRALARAGLLCATIGLAVLFNTGTVQPQVRLAGDPNSGDVWTDNVGQPSGPGHEQDPHLTCTNINIWGAGLADSGGTYVIDGWPPSGSQEQDYSGTWNYNTGSGGSQVIAVVNTAQLIATAQANGDAPANSNGYHFKLVVSQDPRKSKVFWVACGSAAGGGGGGSPTPTPTGSGGGVSATPTPSGSVSGTSTTPTPTPSGSVSGASATPTPGGGGAGGTSNAIATPTPESGVLGISTSSSSPTAASVTPSGGVLGISTAVPLTGTAASPLGWLLLTAGVVMMVAERKKRLHRPSRG